MRDCAGDDYRGYKGDTRSLDYSSCLGIPYVQNPALASSLKPRSPPTLSRASWPEG